MSSDSGFSKSVKIAVAAAAAGVALAAVWWFTRKSDSDHGCKNDGRHGHGHDQSSHGHAGQHGPAAHGHGHAGPAPAGHAAEPPKYKERHVQRVKTPFGYGILDANQPYTESGMMRVHLPNKAMGTLNPADCKLVPSNDPVYVSTPFGVGTLVEPKQYTPDLVPDDRWLFTVVLPEGARASLNAESVRLVHQSEELPRVVTPYGDASLEQPPQPPARHLGDTAVTPNGFGQVVVKFQHGAVGNMNPDSVQRVVQPLDFLPMYNVDRPGPAPNTTKLPDMPGAASKHAEAARNAASSAASGAAAAGAADMSASWVNMDASGIVGGTPAPGH